MARRTSPNLTNKGYKIREIPKPFCPRCIRNQFLRNSHYPSVPIRVDTPEEVKEEWENQPPPSWLYLSSRQIFETGAKARELPAYGDEITRRTCTVSGDASTGSRRAEVFCGADPRREESGGRTCRVWAGSCHPCFLAMAGGCPSSVAGGRRRAAAGRTAPKNAFFGRGLVASVITREERGWKFSML
jgi:hypothetical protein